MNSSTNHSTSALWSRAQQLKGMNNQHNNIWWLTHNHLDESSGIMPSEKKWIPKGHILCDSIYITFSEFRKYRAREWVRSSGGLGMGDRKEVGVAIRETRGIFLVIEMFCIWLYPCQYLRCNVVFIFQDVTLGGNQVKGTWDLCVLFLTTVGQSTIILK